jgi:GAF domain-containing protein
MERENTQLVKLRSLLEIARALTAEKDLDRLLSLILQEVTRVTEADRSSVFLVDRERRQLWSRIAQGLEIKEDQNPTCLWYCRACSYN